MSLSTTIKSAIDAAFTAVDDLTQTVTYNAPGTVTYNPTTGQNNTTSTSTNVKALFISQPYNYDMSIKIEESNPQILIKTSDFTQTLSVNGTFTVAGATYNVVSWSTDPATAMYTINVVRSVA